MAKPEASAQGRRVSKDHVVALRGDLESDCQTASLARLQAAWSSEISGRSLPWYAEELNWR